jgi:hypothetical protein
MHLVFQEYYEWFFVVQELDCLEIVVLVVDHYFVVVEFDTVVVVVACLHIGIALHYSLDIFC